MTSPEYTYTITTARPKDTGYILTVYKNGLILDRSTAANPLEAGYRLFWLKQFYKHFIGPNKKP